MRKKIKKRAKKSIFHNHKINNQYYLINFFFLTPILIDSIISFIPVTFLASMDTSWSAASLQNEQGLMPALRQNTNS